MFLLYYKIPVAFWQQYFAYSPPYRLLSLFIPNKKPLPSPRRKEAAQHEWSLV